MNYNIVSAVANQVFIMALLMAIGFILTKTKILSSSGSRQMSHLLVNIVTPCVIVMAFQDKNSNNSLSDFMIAFFLCALIHLVFIILSKCFFIKSKNNDKKIINLSCSAYSNCGFMGLPLLGAAIGPAGVFIGSAYVAMFNIFIWTHCYGEFNKASGTSSLKKAFINPGIIGVVAALVLFTLNIQLPGAVYTTVNYMAQLNTPIAMLLLGIYLGESKIFASLKNPSIYIVCFFRLLVLPVIIIILLSFLPFNPTILMTLSLSCACPCAAITAIFASESGKDSGYASSVVAISTLFSLATLPLIAYFASMLIK